MRVGLRLLAFIAPAWIPTADAACLHSGYFKLSSEGPWYMSLTVQPGSKCENKKFLSTATAFSKLNAYVLPEHGKLALIEGGKFSYRPVSGFKGEDYFQLEVCGQLSSGGTGCAKLDYHVDVQ